MKTITEKNDLKEKIIFLKEKQAANLIVLKQQYNATINSFKPLSIIKSASEEFIANPDLKSNLIKEVIYLGGNYLSKILLNKNSKNPVNSVLERVLTYIIKKFLGKKL